MPGGCGFKSCHASAIARSEAGFLIVAWFGGEQEGSDDVEIWMSYLKNGRWTSPVMMSRKSDVPCWNPVLFSNKKQVTLYYKKGRQISDWKTFFRCSHDGGNLWSPEKELVPGDESGGRGPVKNKPVLLAGGDVLAGASHENVRGVWRAFFDRSRNNGLNWDRGDYIKAPNNEGLIQPAVWQDENGVHALFRTNVGIIYRSDSFNEGKTWLQAYPTGLPNNNSGIDIIELDDGRLVLVYNPVGSDSLLGFGKRTPLSISLSDDGGISWSMPYNLIEAPGEYSYPAVISEKNVLHITFTCRRETIVYCQIQV